MIIINCLMLAWVISHFEPLQWVLDALPSNMLKWTLIVLTSCFKCVSFWTTFIYTGNPFIASATYIVATLISEALATLNQARYKINKDNG